MIVKIIVNKRFSRLAISIALATSTAVISNSAMAQVQVIDPAQTTTLTGTSGGTARDAACAGSIADAPNHQVKIAQDSNLTFALEGADDATLLILGPQKQRFCVQADKVSKGKIEIPGRWSRGTYDVFVGTRNRNRAAYTITIGAVK
jgi:hypothetical protein